MLFWNVHMSLCNEFLAKNALQIAVDIVVIPQCCMNLRSGDVSAVLYCVGASDRTCQRLSELLSRGTYFRLDCRAVPS